MASRSSSTRRTAVTSVSHDGFPATALSSGADVVVQSPHKTLGSFTQSSLLHLRGDMVDAERVSQALQMLQSSSPSALLLLSLEAAIEEMAANGRARWGDAIECAESARTQISEIPGLVAYGKELSGERGIASFDPCKLVVDDVGPRHDRPMGARWLRDERHLNPEFSDLRRLVFSITVADDDASVARLTSALGALARCRAAREPWLVDRCAVASRSPSEADDAARRIQRKRDHAQGS